MQNGQNRVDEIERDLFKDVLPKWACRPICESLALLPDPVVSTVLKKVLFFVSDNGENGRIWPSKPFTHFRAIITINPGIIRSPAALKRHITIAHEVAHFIHGDYRKTPTPSPGPLLPPPQELAADRKAVEWLEGHFDQHELRRICEYWKVWD